MASLEFNSQKMAMHVIDSALFPGPYCLLLSVVY